MSETSGDGRLGRARRLPPSAQWGLLGLCVLAVLVVLGVGALLRGRAAPPAPSAAAASPTSLRITERQWQSLTLRAAQPKAFADVAATDGKIAVDDDLTTSVYSPYSGQVTRVFVRLGDRVAAGAPLFAVDAQEIAQGQSDLATTAAQVKLATAAEARQHELYDAHGAALKDWQQSQTDLINAQAAYRATRDRLRILGLSDAEMDALAGRPAAALRRETIVRAPRAGVVMQRNVNAGQTIASLTNGGTAAAFVVSDLSKVWLVGNLREAQAPAARVGQAVEMTVTALPGQTFAGRLDFVAPSVDPVTRRVAVRATVANPGERLKPEMFADFSLTTGETRTSVAVPADAVIYEGDAARVWVARAADRSVALRQVTTGRTTGGEVEVLSGLRPGELVVTSGSLFIDRAVRGD
ncbi:efflux RND transporter periplasmic adaptor subunit [Phenylobacterium sp.]|uniref:efflux RND transporter periplasmic adaptor subunit n=1 Tax=Phenylobacterium sp. TaxID=1871053 RepID=UPI001217E1F6|nr:efflux RND transporter periplasmic adaptor subunit [Phenylobacterium sp.]THD58159.1 MAG: efflux RND transporter periplasmic adaptor subunit [Phenylobacterium sp.]